MYVWLDASQKQIQVRGKARRHCTYQHVLFVSCRAVTARETPRAAAEKFSVWRNTNKSSDEDVKKKRSARQAHSCINFHHSRTVLPVVQRLPHRVLFAGTIYVSRHFNLSDRNSAMRETYYFYLRLSFRLLFASFSRSRRRSTDALHFALDFISGTDFRLLDFCLLSDTWIYM